MFILWQGLHQTATAFQQQSLTVRTAGITWLYPHECEGCSLVYTNCNGATIHIGDNLRDPLGKPGWIWIPGSQNYDPTDPAV